MGGGGRGGAKGTSMEWRVGGVWLMIPFVWHNVAPPHQWETIVVVFVFFFTSISSEKEKKWLLNPYGRREKQQRRRRRRRRLEVKSYFRKREEFGSCGFGSGVYVTKNWSFQSDLTPAKIYNFQRFDDRRSSKAEKGGIESFRCCKERTLKDIKCMRETQKESYKYVDSEGRNETYLMKER